MFGLSPWEIAIVVGVILVVAGPTLLPKLGRRLGSGLSGLKESTASFSENLREELERDEEPPAQLEDSVDSSSNKPAGDRA